MRPLDFVRLPNGSVGMITEVSTTQGTHTASVRWIGGTENKCAWWDADEFKIIDNLADLLARELAHPFSNDTLQPYEENFNWWLSSQTAGPRDWSPKTLENQERWKNLCAYNECENTFPGGLRGTPNGDISKYFVMSNGEWDYDQVYSDIEFEGWV